MENNVDFQLSELEDFLLSSRNYTIMDKNDLEAAKVEIKLCFWGLTEVKDIERDILKKCNSKESEFIGLLLDIYEAKLLKKLAWLYEVTEAFELAQNN